MMSRRASKAGLPVLVAAAVLLAVPGRVVSSPTTRPTADIARLFEALSDPDPARRHDAKVELMGLKLEDLPMLREIVEHQSSVEPNAAELLHEIVVQVYLAGQEYEASREGRGWMGIGISQPLLIESESDETAVRSVGMVVDSRMPGFGAYRSLLDGDVVTRIRETPNIVMGTSLDLQRAVGAFRAGDVLHLEVVRGGETVVVPVTLDPRPEQVDASRPEFYAGRAALLVDAEAYFTKQFASVIDLPTQKASAE